MYEIRYKQIDPDTGKIIREEKLATCDSLRHANWVKNALEVSEDDPNREYILIQPEKLSLDQIMREYKPFTSDTGGVWDISIVKEYDNGSCMVMASNGETQYMTKEDIEIYKEKRKNNGISFE